jgi:L-lactate permease
MVFMCSFLQKTRHSMQHECLATTAATLNGKDWTTLHPAIGPLGNVKD